LISIETRVALTDKEKIDLLSTLGERVWISISSHRFLPEQIEIDKGFLGYTTTSADNIIYDWFDRIHPDDKNAFEQHLTGKDQDSAVYNFRFRHANGQYYWVSSGVKIEGQEIKCGWVSHGMLDHENAIQNVIGAAAHDLRSPINSILGAVQLIQLSLVDPNNRTINQGEILNMITSSCNSALDYTSDLLEISALESGNFDLEPDLVDLRKFTTEFVRTHGLRALKKKIKINIEQEGYPVMVLINKNKFSRVLDNILSNAFKFSHVGSEIDISFESDNHEHTLKIKDHGTGMTPEVLSALFEKFGKSGRVGLLGERSTGLGMSIIKQIVEHHKGKLEVVSQEGTGTELKITLNKYRESHE